MNNSSAMPYRMVSRVYQNSLRPFVIIIGSIIAIWALVSAIPAFQDINEDKENGQPKFATFDIVLGSVYAGACVIEVFGVIAAASQKAALVRIYAILSVFASVLVIGAGFLRVIIHFSYKDGLINECIQVAQGEGVEFRFGIWGPRVKDHLDKDEATSFCNSAWNRDSLDEIVLLIFEIVFSIFYNFIAFAYYRQVIDPTSVVNVTRAPANGIGAPNHYNAPYHNEGHMPYDPYASGSMPSYAPPPGPPPVAAGYGVGMGAKDMKDDDNASQITKVDDNPFADFDEYDKPRSKMPPGHAS